MKKNAFEWPKGRAGDKVIVEKVMMNILRAKNMRSLWDGGERNESSDQRKKGNG